MNLLGMVIRDQKKRANLPEAAIIEPAIRSKGPIIEAWVRVPDFLRLNERIAQRQEVIQRRIVNFELRMAVMLNEVQRLKEKHKVT